MKEEDLKKNLDKIIIDGLIKEAEQENADFEAAMKKMSNEDFLELIMDHEHVADEVLEVTGDYDGDSVYRSIVLNEESIKSKMAEPALGFASASQEKAEDLDESWGWSPEKENITKTKKHPFRKFVPWITSALAAAACILAIVLPTVHHANGKLCDGALMMSQQYMTSSKGSFDIASASEEEIKDMLPMLEKNYNDCIKVDGKSVTYTPGLQECGWDLTLAYLKLHKKGKAIDVLKVLAQQYQGTAFGDHCENLLKQLD